MPPGRSGRRGGRPRRRRRRRWPTRSTTRATGPTRRGPSRARAGGVTIVDELPSAERLAPFVARVAAACEEDCQCVGDLVAAGGAPRLARAARRGRARRAIRCASRATCASSTSRGRQATSTSSTPSASTRSGYPTCSATSWGSTPPAVAAARRTRRTTCSSEGDVIRDGDTVPGPTARRGPAAAKSRARRSARDVIDVTPPDPHRARRT